MSKQTVIEPDVVLQMTTEQIKQVLPLKNKQNLKRGMILGSVGIASDDQSGDTIALSYIPYHIAEKIIDLVNTDLGGETSVSS